MLRPKCVADVARYAGSFLLNFFKFLLFFNKSRKTPKRSNSVLLISSKIYHLLFFFHFSLWKTKFLLNVTAHLSNRARFSQLTSDYVIFFRAVFLGLQLFLLASFKIENSKEKCWFSLILLHVFSDFSSSSL